MASFGRWMGSTGGWIRRGEPPGGRGYPTGGNVCLINVYLHKARFYTYILYNKGNLRPKKTSQKKEFQVSHPKKCLFNGRLITINLRMLLFQVYKIQMMGCIRSLGSKDGILFFGWWRENLKEPVLNGWRWKW